MDRCPSGARTRARRPTGLVEPARRPRRARRRAARRGCSPRPARTAPRTSRGRIRALVDREAGAARRRRARRARGPRGRARVRPRAARAAAARPRRSTRSWSAARARCGSSARGRLEPDGRALRAPRRELRHAIERILAPLGRRVDEAEPLCDARLPDGSRVNVVLPPLAVDGPALTIRRFRRARPHAARPRRARHLDRGAARRCSRGAVRARLHDPRQRRHRLGQDDDAQRPVVVRRRRRAHRHDRGHRRAAPRSSRTSCASRRARRASRAAAR